MRGTSALVGSAGKSDAQVTAIPVVNCAGIPTGLPGRVEHQQIGDRLEPVVNGGSVEAVGLVRPLDDTRVPVGPINVILVLRYTERIDDVLGHDLFPLLRQQVVAVDRRGIKIRPVKPVRGVIDDEAIRLANVGQYHLSTSAVEHCSFDATAILLLRPVHVPIDRKYDGD